MKFGLDFGTTNSSLAVAKNGQAEVIKIDHAAVDPRVVRSMLYFNRREIVYSSKVSKQQIEAQVFKLGDIQYGGVQINLIGQQAVEKYLSDNAHRTAGTKRRIYTGRWIKMKDNPDQPKTDPVPEYYEEIDYGTGRLIQALKSSLKTSFRGTTIFGKFYSVEELISIYVGEIKKKAEEEIGEKIEEIKVGRPVHFSQIKSLDERAENRLEEALKLSGFKKVSFEFEPVAAAKQYISTLDKKEQVIFVFDFGGGTLDTAIVKVGAPSTSSGQVMATDGVYIGGDLLNSDIMQAKLWDYFGAKNTWGDQKLPTPMHLYEALNSWYSIPSLNNPDTLELLERLKYKNSNPQALEKLIYLIKANVGFEVYEAIERAKKELSKNDEAWILYQDGPIDLSIRITRKEFENIIDLRVEEIRNVVLETLKQANLKPDQVDKVVRTGGSSLIPVFEKMLESIFGKEKITIFETFTSIAAGLTQDTP